MSPHETAPPTSLTWENYRLLVDSVVDYAIFMLDPSGRVATWNLGAERIKGYTADEIIGQHFSKFYPPEDIEAGKPERELKVATNLGRVEDEGWRVRKDGSRFWADVVITALRDDRGRLRGFAKVTRDLTERRKSEETARDLAREQAARVVAEEGERKLRESEERYRSLSARLEVVLEGIADGITVQQRDGTLTFANEAAARLCGFDSADELVATPAGKVVERFEMLDEDGQPFPLDALPGRRVLRGERDASALIHVRQASTGRDSWSLVRAKPVLAPNGEHELAVNIWHDVTDERRREQQTRYLAETSAALAGSLDYEAMLATFARVLVPDLADWCSVHLLEGEQLRNIVTFHVDPDKVAAAREYEAAHPPDPRAPRGVWNVLRTGESELYNDITDALLVQTASTPEHLRLLRAAGMRAVLIAPIRGRDRVTGTISLVSAESSRRYDEQHVALVEEVGRRAGVAIENAQLYKAAQEAARNAEAAARRADDANRIKDEFLATVSHELRTPLNAIVGWSSLLRERTTDPSVTKGVEVIHRNALAQSKIIEDILEVSRIITGKLRLELKPTDLAAVAREAAEVVRPSALAKRISIDFVVPAEPQILIADPERLQQVVWNLLSNAVKFTDSGGSIVVRTERVGSKLVLSVTDTGRGIAPAFLPHVFERFQQADSSTTRRVGGLGLGLAIVRHLVELHGGRVEATSAGVGAGATFTITLPVRAVVPPIEEPLHVEPSASPAEERPPGLEGLRVLVVDDEPDATDLLETLLANAGASVETAASAADAFERVQRFRPHVLLSDIGMPEEDGYGLMRRIRALDAERGGGVPSIALTAYARGEDETRALSAGFTVQIGKPVDPNTLLKTVKSLAERADDAARADDAS